MRKIWLSEYVYYEPEYRAPMNGDMGAFFICGVDNKDEGSIGGRQITFEHAQLLIIGDFNFTLKDLVKQAKKANE